MAKMVFSIFKSQKKGYFRTVFFIVPFFLVCIFSLAFFVSSATAAAGINKTINFQGKLVDNNGLNVSNGSYTVVFTLYDAASGGTNLWTETQTVTTTDGIFQVALGSVNTALGSVNFNSDSLYLGIKVGSDAEMTPRIRFAAVPYAMNASTVNGLTVTNTSGNPFSSTTKLQIGDGKTVVFNNGLTFSGTDSTTFTFPTTSGTVVTLDATQTLTGKSIGAGGLTFAGAATDITTGPNEDFVIAPNGTGKVGINAATPQAAFDVRGNSGTLAVASFSGQTSLVGLIVDNSGIGDILTASTGGVPKFTIQNNGTLVDSTYTTAGGIFYGNSNGTLKLSSAGSSGNCLVSNGASAPTWATCATGSNGTNYLTLNAGMLYAGNTTTDFAIGGTATGSAKFAVLGVNTGTPTASVSSGVNGTASYLTATGTLGSANKQSLTLGDTNTGNIQFFSGANTFTAAGNFSLAGTITAAGSGVTLSGNNASLAFTGTGANQITTASNQNLALMPGGSGFVGIGTTTPSAKLDVAGTASISGLLNIYGATPALQSTANQTLTIGGNTTGNIVLSPNGGTNGSITFAGYASGVLHSTNGVLSSSALNLAGGASEITGILPVVNGGSPFQLSTDNGAIIQRLTTQDFLLGGTATSSAKFAVLGINTGTPTASISATSGTNQGNGVVLGGDGSIQSLRNNTLTIGGATTGNISLTNNTFLSGNFTQTGTGAFTTATGLTTIGGSLQINGTGITLANNTSLTLGSTPNTSELNIGSGLLDFDTTNSRLGVGTITPFAKLDVRGLTGAAPIASFSGTINNNAGFVIDNSGTGDIFTASKSGATKFTINNAGDLLLAGLTRITTGGVGAFANGTLVGTDTFGSNSITDAGALTLTSATGNNTLTLQNGSATGNIQFFNGNSTLTSTGNLTLGGMFSVNQAGVIATKTSIDNAGNILPGSNGSANIGSVSQAWNNIYANNIYAAGTTGTQGWWQRIGLSGVIAPTNITDDLLLGGTSTSSARVAFINMTGSGEPTASIAGSITLRNGTGLINRLNGGSINFQTSPGGDAGLTTKLYIGNNGNIGVGTISPSALLDVAGTASISGLLNIYGTNPALQSTLNQTLTIGGNTTGNIQFQPGNATNGLYLTNNNTVGIGTINPVATLDVVGTTGTAAAGSFVTQSSFASLFANNTGVGDLFTASNSAGTKFTILNNGNVQINNLSNGGTTGNLLLYTNSSTGVLGSIGGTNTQNLCLLSGANGGAAVPSWQSCSFGTTSNWNITSGALTPQLASTVDFLIGGTATASAKFAVLNVNKGNPTATMSGTMSILGTTGSLGTTGAAGAVGTVGTNAEVVLKVLGGVGGVGGAGGAGTGIGQAGGAGAVGGTGANVLFVAGSGGTGGVGGAGGPLGGTQGNGGQGGNGGNIFLTPGDAGAGGTGAAAGAIGNQGNLLLGVNQLGTAIGSVGIGTLTPLATFDLRDNGDTKAVASISGNSKSFATLVVNNSGGAGGADIFTASSSGQNRFVIGNNGNVNIGTQSAAFKPFKFYVSDYETATASAMIENTAGAGSPVGLIVQLGYTSTTLPNNSPQKFIDFRDGLGRRRGSIAAGGTGVQFTTSGVADFAEYIAKDDTQTYNFGDLICLNAQGIATECTTTSGEVVGVMSDTASFIGGDETTGIPVGLVGIVHTTVTNSAGAINPGDPITVSDMPGVGVKALTAGRIVGRAMEAYDSDVPGRIAVVVQPGWFDPSSPIGDVNQMELNLSDSQNGLDYALKDAQGEEVTTQIAAQVAKIANLSTGLLISKSITTDGLQVNGTITAQDLHVTTITVDTIHANHIQIPADAWKQAFADGGLESIESRLTTQDARITNLENLFATKSAVEASPTPDASAEANITKLTQLLQQDTTASVPSGIASVSGKAVIDQLQVTGSVLVEGMLHVVDFLTARNLIVDQLATFLGDVVFNGNTFFSHTPVFSQDTAGLAIIKKGTDRVDVRFSKEYPYIPFVNASMTVMDVSPLPNEAIQSLLQRQNDQEQQLLQNDVHFIVTQRTTKGFTIVIDKKAAADISFSWVAVSVENPVVQSGNGDNHTINQTSNDENQQPILSNVEDNASTSSIESDQLLLTPSPQESVTGKEVSNHDSN